MDVGPILDNLLVTPLTLCVWVPGKIVERGEKDVRAGRYCEGLKDFILLTSYNHCNHWLTALDTHKNNTIKNHSRGKGSE